MTENRIGERLFCPLTDILSFNFHEWVQENKHCQPASLVYIPRQYTDLKKQNPDVNKYNCHLSIAVITDLWKMHYYWLI